MTDVGVREKKYKKNQLLCAYAKLPTSVCVDNHHLMTHAIVEIWTQIDLTRYLN
jgi:hypothetical protein